MYQLKYELIGKSGGDFSPKYTEPEQSHFLTIVARQLNQRGISKVFSPHCKMTTNVARAGNGDDKIITPWFTWFMRTPPGVDGAMITEPGVAIALFNADCPVTILFDKHQGRLVVLHSGFRCLVPQNSNMPNIIQTAFSKFNLNPDTLEAFIGFGAGRCCYGIDNYLNELDKPKYWPFLWKVQKGPRIGQRSLDLYNLVRNQLRNHGLMEKNISVNYNCTACEGRENNGQGLNHSNIYEGKSAGRNLVLVRFEK